MKRIFLYILTTILLTSAALSAQDIAGAWQGTLQAGSGLRTILKVSKGDKNGWKAVFYSIDQSGQGVPVSSITLQGKTLKFAIAGNPGGYEGKLSADGNAIVGSWSMGDKAMALNLERATNQTAWTIPGAAPSAMMAADVAPVFDSASIVPSKPKTPLSSGGWPEYKTHGTSLIALLIQAYGLPASQIVGAPAWAYTDKYDLDAKSSAQGAPSDEQFRSALRKLLEQRFKITTHTDKKDLSFCEIALGKDAPKLTKSENQSTASSYTLWQPGTLVAKNTSIQDLGKILGGSVLGKVVFDRTGLKDRYDITLRWTPDEYQLPYQGSLDEQPPYNGATPPDIYLAVSQQLGLKFAVKKGPVDVVVIDHAEKPASN
jgi:uncharacterized protein (TIGR03435 family)